MIFMNKCEVTGLRIGFRHDLPEIRLGARVPVGAVELKENGGVGQRQVGLEHEDVERLPGLVELGDDLFVQQHLHGAIAEQSGQFLSIGVDAGCVFSQARFSVRRRCR